MIGWLCIVKTHAVRIMQSSDIALDDPYSERLDGIRPPERGKKSCVSLLRSGYLSTNKLSTWLGGNLSDW